MQLLPRTTEDKNKQTNKKSGETNKRKKSGVDRTISARKTRVYVRVRSLPVYLLNSLAHHLSLSLSHFLRILTFFLNTASAADLFRFKWRSKAPVLA